MIIAGEKNHLSLLDILRENKNKLLMKKYSNLNDYYCKNNSIIGILK